MASESVGENDAIFHNDSDDTDVTGSHDKFAFDYVGKFVLGSVGKMSVMTVESFQVSSKQ